ncbi:MAG: UDP-N-acetylmuramoyl-L-alanyl-D-glutamate--2,6-diaminopimelate ligase [Opitutia bacterium UBA7350]|nr:MAG: UDP-N-acetylmuramoyl-L-alanyl-D-glutamate--2,6-diaminopimelate ligase [Opitutae bacterium UBA7350]
MELAECQISLLLDQSFIRAKLRNKAQAFKMELPQSRKGHSIGELVECMDGKNFNGKDEAEITCLITDSRRVVPGALFFAIGGLRTDGNFYIEEAVDRGAVAIVSEKNLGDHMPVPCIRVSDVREALALAARQFYDLPDADLKITGITGTNGKTTVAMLLQHLLGGNKQVGMLGTVRYDLGNRTLPSFKTTPESVDTFALLDQIRAAGCQEVAMEISSHGLEQKRVFGMSVEVAAFLNLTRDHIDYHQTMEAYFASKKLLFNGGNGRVPKSAVINLDCPYGHQLAAVLDSTLSCTTFAIDAKADIFAEAVHLSKDHTEFTLHWNGGRTQVRSPLLGRHNVSNLLAALAIGLVRAYPMDAMLARLDFFPAVPGRMERVVCGQKFNVLVDYAHTDDALYHACTMVRELTSGQSILVFGCGGDRDRTKRAPMLKAAILGADIIIVTSDNPRTESQDQIFEDMRTALSAADFERVQFIPDRKRAISIALDLAKAEDCVLVAGKGHERYQEFDGSVISFDDRQVIRELWDLKARDSAGQ